MITPFPLSSLPNPCPRCGRSRPKPAPAPRPAPSEREGAFEPSDFLAELRRNFRYDPGLEWARSVRP